MNYIEEAEEFLKSYLVLVKKIENIEDTIKSIEEDMSSCRSITYREVHYSNKFTHDDYLARFIDLKNLKIKEKQAIKNKLKFIEKSINNMDSLEGEILKSFYLKNYTIREMEKDLHISERQIHNIKKSAIKRFSILLFGVVALGHLN